VALLSVFILFLGIILFNDDDLFGKDYHVHEFQYKAHSKPKDISNELYERTTIYFESKGYQLESFLYRPKGVENPPVLITAHGVVLPKDAGIVPLIEHLLKKGFAVFSFDYRKTGGSEGEPRHAVKISEQVYDLEQALKYVTRNVSGVNPQKIALYGYSLGGGNVVHVASHPEKLAKENITVSAVVLWGPHADGLKNSIQVIRANGHSLDRLKFVILVFQDVLLSFFGKIRYVPVAGPMAALSQEDYVDYLAAVEPAQKEGIWQNKLPGRSFFEIIMNRPVLYADAITAHTLIVGCETDHYIDKNTLFALDEAIPSSTLEMLPTGHFGVLDTHFEQAAKLTSDFLIKHLKD